MNYMLLSQQSLPVLNELDEKEHYYGSLALKIWDWAELGYLEFQSSALLQETLEKEGFTVNSGVAEIPTAFIASYGSGKPIIAILGEYDALPGLSQDSLPTKKSLGKSAGHACGHHLFGVGSAAAAIAVKNWMQNSGQTGTLRYYGCPAEEGGSGKVYMTRSGLFDDVDIVIHWHPGSSNSANASSSLANISAKFRFRGVSAHAAGAPEKGRSALDGVEAMNHMVNMMREHVPDDTRIHYVITDGGKAPNVVPDFAEVYYYARSPRRSDLVNIWEWIVKASEGAAMGTGTRVQHEIIGGVYEILPIESLARIAHRHLENVGGVHYDYHEIVFARKISESLTGSPEFSSFSHARVEPFEIKMRKGGGSTDVGDISWVVPTVGLRTATWVPNTPAHSWQAVAAGGMSIGRKGMMVAAKSMALTAMDLFLNPDHIKEAWEEFESKRGISFQYKALIGDRAPALDYRK
ncbi:MAG TPA: amidohydrolase [Saprospiraceae bacterium]|nr:amidohydrolase [Saprospiraceae bacterium]